MIGPVSEPRTLVDVADLAANPAWRVFDCRHVLTDPGKGVESYAAGHVPGALHAHLDEVLAGPRSATQGRHPLPAVEVFIEWLGRCGVSAADTVVAYDDSGGIFAARLWWMLRWVGHRRAAVLNGGFAAWIAASLPVETGTQAVAATRYAGQPDDTRRVTVGHVEANLARRALQLVDARAANRFAGRDETLDPVGGHIPGALNRPYTFNLDAQGRFKAPEALRAEFLALLGDRAPGAVVHQCGSGVTACHNLLAMEWAGLRGSRLYPGSWSEWCSDPARGVETGAAGQS